MADGDTFTMITGSIGARNLKKVKVRLAEIDAPESDQAYGKDAKRSLMGMVMGKEVIVRVQDKDRRSRIVGRVYVQRSGEVIDVNGEQLRLGWAWIYPQYLKDQRLPAVEADARANHRGLWAQAESELVAPWDWRHNR